MDKLPDLARKIKPRLGKCLIVCHYEPLFRLVVTKVPIGMERGGKIEQIEGDSVRFARGGCGFDQPGELRRQLDQTQLFLAKQFECGIGRRKRALVAHTSMGSEWPSPVVLESSSRWMRTGRTTRP